MSNEQQLDNSVKFRTDYQWPDKDAERDCPKCNEPMQRQEDLPEYYGKPWWCHTCQWQFSEEELND